MDPASSIFGSSLEDDPSKPTMSKGPPKTPQLLKKPWGGLGDAVYYHELFAHPYLSTRHECFAPEGPLPDWIQTVLNAVDPQF